MAMTNLSIEENYGKWKSSLAAKDLAKKSIGFGDVYVDCGMTYWTESRPGEKGRSVIVSRDVHGEIREETSSVYNVAAGVHGYGGGAFLAQDNILYFTDAITNQVYKKDCQQNTIVQITNSEGFSYADFSVDKSQKFIYCLRLNKNSKSQFPTTEIVRIETLTGLQEVLFSGADFYSNVRVNEDGTKILFLQWNYPNMPWDENELWTADIQHNKVTNLKKIFHKQQVSLYQPLFIRDAIYSVFNVDNYWNIFEIKNEKLTNLFEYVADFGRPLWLAGTRTFAFISEHEILATCCEKGIWKTFLLEIKNKTQILVENGLTCIQNMAADKNSAVYIGGNATLELGIRMDPAVAPVGTPRDDISQPELIEFTSNNKKVYAFYYPPKNNQYHAPKNTKPPCIIKIHGGPTSCADFMLNPKIQYYTNRGYAYVELNYGGSSGYGKEYRARLNKKWGVVDVEDCIACANFLCEVGLADKNKLILAGSSAGGFTLLNVLTRSQLFKCASCHYGIADLFDMANHIHKFEACYDQNLIGDTLLNNPNLYKERSPINYVQNIKTPIIFFHGDNDPVVHMNQTLLIAEVLKNQNVYHEVTIFEGEGHGFKKEETIISVLEKELAFFEKIL